MRFKLGTDRNLVGLIVILLLIKRSLLYVKMKTIFYKDKANTLTKHN